MQTPNVETMKRTELIHELARRSSPESFHKLLHWKTYTLRKMLAHYRERDAEVARQRIES